MTNTNKTAIGLLVFKTLLETGAMRSLHLVSSIGHQGVNPVLSGRQTTIQYNSLSCSGQLMLTQGLGSL